MIKAVHLTKIYKTDAVAVVALDDVSFEIKKENLWLLLALPAQANLL